MSKSLEKWKAVTQQPPVVEFFRGLFDRVGIRIADTCESFTCIHRGDRIEFDPDLVEKKADFTVTIQSFQVDRLAQEAGTGQLTELERYRILCALFTPATQATLENPLLAHPIVRRLLGAEDLIHVTLTSPSPEEPDTSHTLLYAARQWLAIPGLHGVPKRTFVMTMDQALEYHRKSLEAIKENKLVGWMQFAKWYRKWRPAVSHR